MPRMVVQMANDRERPRREGSAERSRPAGTDRIRCFYDRKAHSYDRWLAYYDRWMKVGESRHRLLSHARGQTLEVGAGTGVNLPHYPVGVKLTAVELSPAMLEVARRRATRLGIAVDLRLGHAAAMDFADGQFDTVVATHFLSVVADEQRVVSEIDRVLRPGGHLLVLDHVQSHLTPVRLIQKVLDPVATRYSGWHIGRDLVGLLTSHGFLIDQRRRSRLGMLDEVVGRRAADSDRDESAPT
jgi:ubiquinone/menaquinone biosynthesis C-methylase UbiE